MPLDKNAIVGSVDEELADVLIYICSIANRSGIDLEQAFRDKEDVNKKRTWENAPEGWKLPAEGERYAPGVRGGGGGRGL